MTSYNFVFLFDTRLRNIDGEERECIEYVGHNRSTVNSYDGTQLNSCSHTYEQLLNMKSSSNYYRSYIYAPEFPQNSKTEKISNMMNYLDSLENIIICDWREIIYQMAKDYRKHNHEDDFYIQIRENNGKDINGEWRYPDGITSYEPFYIDLEGFWRQLYCPRYL